LGEGLHVMKLRLDHPTNDGHKYLAQRIAPLIANTLTHA
jgi:hypothetical protein